MEVPIIYSSYNGGIKEDKALVDSGATSNFIDHRTAERWQLGTKDLDKPIQIFNVDGTENKLGRVTKFSTLRIRMGKLEELQNFFITDLGMDHVILGYPWLETFNPRLNWKNRTLDDENPKICLESQYYHTAVALKEKARVLLARTLETAGKSQEWAIVDTERRTASSAAVQGIPLEYQRHTFIFDEEAAKHFPPSQGKFDMEIKLKPDAPDIINCKVYLLTEEGKEITKKFLKEHQEKGYIEQTDSPWSSPWFLIPKADGSSRPVQDYRHVNEHTIPDIYPLPRIENLLEQLHGMRYFTTLDIRWGYHNIRIKDEDQWKAAFKTPYGLFKPKVMFFGL
jgi:gag-polyprotein putative aspartyl protease